MKYNALQTTNRFLLILFLFAAFCFASCNSDNIAGTDGDTDFQDNDTAIVVDNCIYDTECQDDLLCHNNNCIDPTESDCIDNGLCVFDVDCKAGEFCNNSCWCVPIDPSDGDKVEEDEDIEIDGDWDDDSENDTDIIDDCDLGPQISSQAELDFGYVSYDTDSTKTLNITNTCDNTLTIHSVEIVSNTTEFTFVDPPTFPLTLTGINDVLQVTVRYHPTDIGDDQDEILISSDDPDGGYRVALKSHYKGVSDISITPNPLEFHTVVVGENATTKTLIIKNEEGGADDNAVLRINSVYLESDSGSIFRILNNPTPFYLGQGQEKEITIECDPSASGEFSDTIKFDSNDPDEPTASIEVTATAVEPTIDIQTLLDNNRLSFGVQRVSKLTEINLTITNTGGGTLTVQEPALTASTPDTFALETSNFSSGAVDLQLNDPVTFSVSFVSNNKGSFNGQIRIDSNSLQNPVFYINLDGRAELASIEANPTPIDFGELTLGNSDTETLTLTNNSEVQITIESIEFTNPTTVLSFDSNDILKNIVLEPTEYHEINISFVPEAIENYNNMIHIVTDDSGNSALDIPVNAAGQGSVMEITQKDNEDYQGKLDFGQVNIGESKELILQITNAGQVDMSLSNLEFLSNSNDDEFSLADNTLLDIAVGETKELVVIYSPVILPGNDIGSLRITSDASISGDQLISLEGVAANPSILFSDSAPLMFNTLYFGDSQTRTISITNGGHIGNLRINNVELSTGSEAFSIEFSETLPIELAPDATPANRESLDVSITFTPPLADSGTTSAIDYNGLIKISTNSVEEEITDYQLSGQGKPCPAGCWDLDEDHSECEYCGCMLTNNGIEICDNKDNDCNGTVDDGENVTDNCNPPENAEAICSSGMCDFACNNNFHDCDGACLYDWDVNSCGELCEPCETPENAVASCEDQSGTPTCNWECLSTYIFHNDKCRLPGSIECCGPSCIDCGGSPENGTMVCENDSCKLYCETNFHACGSLCKSNDSVDHCGTSCIPCNEPANNGHATCDGASCGIECDAGNYEQNGECESCDTATHCGISCEPCGTMDNGEYQCITGQCRPVCEENFHLCGDECVADDSINHCGNNCESCESINGTINNGGYTCNNGTCEVSCGANYHLCGDTCVSNDSVNNCGALCESCESVNGVVANGSYTCNSGSCEATCNANFHLCGDNCLSSSSPDSCGTNCSSCESINGAITNGSYTCNNGTCEASCPAGTHLCDNACLSDSSVNSCGSSCSPCKTLNNATAGCNGIACTYSCNGTYENCNNDFDDPNSDGCEADLTQPETCITCFNDCTDFLAGNNDSATCSGGCNFSCTNNKHDCNDDLGDLGGNGCETTFGTTSNCTGCGDSCSAPANATATCTGSGCDFNCNSGYNKCTDSCSKVTTLTYGVEYSSWNTCSNGTDMLEPYNCTNGDNATGTSNEMIFKWVADRTSEVVIIVEPTSSWDPILVVLNNGCSNSCGAISDDPESSNAYEGFYITPPSVGTTYYFALDGYGTSSCGDFRIGIATEEEIEDSCNTTGNGHHASFAFTLLLLLGWAINAKRRSVKLDQ